MFKNNENLFIIKKTMIVDANNYLLKLNRLNHQLEVYIRVENEELYNYHSIRKDFDSSAYVIFEKLKEFKCIIGDKKSPTPIGIFNIEYKSREKYISGYHPNYDKVKFFGYLVVFEDYFIHSDIYMIDVKDADILNNRKEKIISKGDKTTSGCLRVSQENLDWLVENIEIGTTVLF